MGIETNVVVGTVLDSSRLSHTEVYSSGGGGGGYVGPYGGHVSVSAPVVSSTSSTDTDIFLQLKDGKERHFRIYDRDIPLRPGHRVHVALAKCRREWEIGLVYNESIDTYGKCRSTLAPGVFVASCG